MGWGGIITSAESTSLVRASGGGGGGGGGGPPPPPPKKKKKKIPNLEDPKRYFQHLSQDMSPKKTTSNMKMANNCKSL